MPINRNSNYITMSVKHLKDKNLSLQAKGLLSIMFSFSDGDEVTCEELADLCIESAEEIDFIVDELEELGYLERID